MRKELSPYEKQNHMKWGHAQNYHITLDSSALGIDKCVEILKHLY